MSKERPILFSAPMVRALLDGSKSQTRRAVKPEPSPYWNPVVGLYNPVTIDNGGYEAPGPEIFGASDETQGRRSPYGQPGDRLRVRETFFAFGRWETRYSEKKKRDEWHFVDMTGECGHAYQYAADAPDLPLAAGRGGALPGWHKRPAIFMPRAASRILLEIVSVRVERLNDCSEMDAIAEGIEKWGEPHPRRGQRWNCPPHAQRFGSGDNVEDAGFVGGAVKDPREAYRGLWASINGPGSWEANPFVWVISFRRVVP
jgi:hypothetical protein